MKLFEKLNWAKLGKRLEELKAQLAAADAAVEDRQAALEQALADEKPSEKPLSDLALSRTRSEALRSVIGKAEVALSQVQEREQLAASIAAHRAAEEKLEALKIDLAKKAEKIIAAHSALKAAAADFDASAAQLRELAGAWAITGGIQLIPRGEAYACFDWAHNPVSDLNSVVSIIQAQLRGSRENLEVKLRQAAAAEEEG